MVYTLADILDRYETRHYRSCFKIYTSSLAHETPQSQEKSGLVTLPTASNWYEIQKLHNMSC